ncbi:hypothetical protein ACIBK9_51720 [Nonomuraea sp. NPDC050227]|uniref:hypothetical protein n=1 Tax=Nonomuraea sp. NPDC050227 TaxID=3364360 RepID=UPI0037ADAABA
MTFGHGLITLALGLLRRGVGAGARGPFLCHLIAGLTLAFLGSVGALFCRVRPCFRLVGALSGPCRALFGGLLTSSDALVRRLAGRSRGVGKKRVMSPKRAARQPEASPGPALILCEIDRF